jgi:hypothetical protein
MRWVMLFFLALSLAVLPVLPAEGQTGAESPPSDAGRIPSGGAMLVDGLIVRPIGILAIAIGFVGTVVTLPFSIPSGNVNAVAQTLIGNPFTYTFTRPLGEFPGKDEELLD